MWGLEDNEVVDADLGGRDELRMPFEERASIDSAQRLLEVSLACIDDRSHSAFYAGHINHDRNAGYYAKVFGPPVVVRNLRTCKETLDRGVANIDACATNELPLYDCDVPAGRCQLLG